MPREVCHYGSARTAGASLRNSASAVTPRWRFAVSSLRASSRAPTVVRACQRSWAMPTSRRSPLDIVSVSFESPAQSNSRHRCTALLSLRPILRKVQARELGTMKFPRPDADDHETGDRGRGSYVVVFLFTLSLETEVWSRGGSNP